MSTTFSGAGLLAARIAAWNPTTLQRWARWQTSWCLIKLNDSLQRLAEQSPWLAQVVECRYFVGYDEQATARAS